MKGGNDALLIVAAMLGIAAYLFAEEDADAAPGSTGVSGNGFAVNNPLNLRFIASNPFNGQTGQTAQGIGTYDTLSNGVRAAGMELTDYYNRGLTTITQIVSTWAPPFENNTAAYIANVAASMGDDADEPLSWPNDEVPLIQAMARQENGYNNMADSDVQTYINS